MNHEVEVVQLDLHTWMLSEGTGRGRTHCYLLEGDDFAVLIDTGLYVVNLKEVTSLLTSKQIRVINTHGHFDHTANNHQFSIVYLHPDDETILKEYTSSELRFSYIKNRYISAGYTNAQLQTHDMQKELRLQAQLPVSVPFTPVYDGMQLDLGGRIIKILATPGHTQGSICVLDEQYRRLYTGDSICEDGVLLHFLHSASVQTYAKSLQKLINEEHCFDELYCGHQRVPLNRTMLHAFMHCAKHIMEGKNLPIRFETDTGNGYRMTFEGATISYLP